MRWHMRQEDRRAFGHLSLTIQPLRPVSFAQPPETGRRPADVQHRPSSIIGRRMRLVEVITGEEAPVKMLQPVLSELRDALQLPSFNFIIQRAFERLSKAPNSASPDCWPCNTAAGLIRVQQFFKRNQFP